ncbi:hypothetical protein [Streptomyces sp. NPDC008139]|uniref:hypothetical protein n=1 Tax=Streptomyces sp. NPDC008139 TaxID=3364814 RepID=UPI0036DFE03A
MDLSDLAESTQLRTAMAVESLPGFHCMCLGDVRFEFFGRDGERLAVVVLHHGATLRWGQWEGDAVLANGYLLLAWLDRHGMPGPTEQFEADRQRAEEGAEEERSWLAAMPTGLEGSADRILDLSRTGARPSPDLLAGLTERLQSTFPDPVERVLALLHWHGSGSGRCSGYPVHEDVPGQLLGRVPIADLLTALADQRAEERHDAGAVRHLVGWKTRPRQKLDVAGLPRTPARPAAGACSPLRRLGQTKSRRTVVGTPARLKAANAVRAPDGATRGSPSEASPEKGCTVPLPPPGRARPPTEGGRRAHASRLRSRPRSREERSAGQQDAQEQSILGEPRGTFCHQ